MSAPLRGNSLRRWRQGHCGHMTILGEGMGRGEGWTRSREHKKVLNWHYFSLDFTVQNVNGCFLSNSRFVLKFYGAHSMNYLAPSCPNG